MTSQGVSNVGFSVSTISLDGLRKGRAITGNPPAMPLPVSAPLVDDSPDTEVSRTLQQLLGQIGGCKVYPLFITSSMAFLWTLCALSAISPAFMAPAGRCVENCSFVTIQDELEVNGSFIDPAELTSSVYFFGNFLVGHFYATLADKFGRRPVIVGSLLSTGVAGVLGSLAPSFEYLLLARFFQGSFFTPLTMVNWVLCGESLPRKAHGAASMAFGSCWVLGYCILAPLSLLFPTWRKLQLASSMPNVFVAIFLYFTLPESITFTAQTESCEKVERWIRKNEQLNGQRLNYQLSKIMESSRGENENKRTVREIVREMVHNQRMALHTLIEAFIWMLDFMLYCALSLTSTSLEDVDPLVSFLFSGIVELPAYLFLPLILKWIKLRTAVSSFHVLGSAALVAMFFLQPGSAVYLPVWLTAKFAASCCYISCYVRGTDLFPAFCRTCCLGVCATLCNIGAISAPYVFALDHWYSNSQFLVMASTSLLCVALVQLLP
ncbi:unnamed protein product [Caenorhabditis auriculariae]|uniref:Major facilitator superfamily (MFS) profile domain-containing protein n=1 Tax=Caenorhabditis auriculariae TaxID=2777116 RepID=A0A8S1GZN9_9PELO|nr:unnamed protein product [Caenorhabditis auriculariae]